MEHTHHVGIDHREGGTCIAEVTRLLPQAGGIEGKEADFAIDAGDDIARSAQRCPFVRFAREAFVLQIHAARILLARLEFVEAGASVGGGVAAGAVDLEGRHGSAVATAMAVVLTFHILLGGMGLPVHLQTVGEPGFAFRQILVDAGSVLGRRGKNGGNEEKDD